MMIYLLKMMKTYGDFPLLGFKKKMRIIYYDHGTPQRVYGDDGTTRCDMVGYRLLHTLW